MHNTTKVNIQQKDSKLEVKGAVSEPGE